MSRDNGNAAPSNQNCRCEEIYASCVAAVHDLHCWAPRSPLGEEEHIARNEIVLTRSGVFRSIIDGAEAIGEPTSALFFNRSTSARYAHPLPGGHRSLVLAPSDRILAEILAALGREPSSGVDRPFDRHEGPASIQSILLLRHLLACIDTGAMLDADETAVALVSSTIRNALDNRLNGRRNQVASRERRTLVDRVRLFVHSSYTRKLRLATIANEVGYSPYHMSRVFKSETGSTIHSYVNRLRMLAALDAIGRTRDLSALALDLGFSSHSHFTATFHREFGAPPRRLRGLFATSDVVELRKLVRTRVDFRSRFS